MTTYTEVKIGTLGHTGFVLSSCFAIYYLNDLSKTFNLCKPQERGIIPIS